ncbi:hypothetical protein [Flavivirga eckloniae]|uniref:Peptidase S74 domain-containing protein n=1 Tax=Flavivirga eckloniae TaxID=1803846 RepID=A0A2K9PRM4_9FLAO|nr:hypothetical protein [Flavivirga eckloniae]AUP79696.1 hypothetical protein C1H87_13655 [Flavivirga eckloniae]
MKKQALIFCLSLFILQANAQDQTINGTTFKVNGNVGIGTTTPSADLEIKGNMKLGLTHTLVDGGYLSVSSKWGDWMTFVDGYSNDTYNFHNPNNGGRLELYIEDGQTNARNFGVFTVLKSGNIGVGTKTPSEKLQVNGLIRIPSANNQDNNSPGIVLASNDDFLYDNQYLNHYGFGFHGYQDGSSSHTEPNNAYMSGYFGVDFFTNGQNRMRISRGGIVSIGSVERQLGYKLAVNGNIKAKEIRVETGWSDFVFEDSYNLPSLKEVESHIKEKGHLKDIPSAEEVAKHGIFLGKMDSKLLQKIEELTLYTIDQEKRIENLESKNEKLIALVEKLINKQSE